MAADLVEMTAVSLGAISAAKSAGWRAEW
jgi:hypothetical protein